MTLALEEMKEQKKFEATMSNGCYSSKDGSGNHMCIKMRRFIGKRCILLVF